MLGGLHEPLPSTATLPLNPHLPPPCTAPHPAPQVAHGSKSVFVPAEREDEDSDSDAEEGSVGAVDAKVAVQLAAKQAQQGDEPPSAPAFGSPLPSRALGAIEAKAAAAERAAGSLSIFERQAGGAGEFTIGTAHAPSNPAFSAADQLGQEDALQQGGGQPEQDVFGGSQEIAATLLPPGAALSTAAADRAALESYRRSGNATGSQPHSSRGTLRRRTTSTPEEH